MKQNIKILTQECCDNLLTFSSRRELRDKYNHGKFDSSEMKYVNMPTKYFIDDNFDLLTISSPLSRDDCKNSIELFKQLKNMNKVQANDKRLWVCLTHTRFLEYTRRRWKISSADSDQ